MNLSRGSRLVVLAVLPSESLHDGMHLRGVSSGVVGLEYLVHGFETDVARLRRLRMEMNEKEIDSPREGSIWRMRHQEA